MAAKNTAKAQKLALELADRLKVRANLSSLAVSVSYDATDGCAIIQVGTLATTDAGALIKVEAADWPLAKDIFGNAAIAFSPHSAHILTEAGPAGGLTSAEKLDLLAQVAAMGTEVKLYESTSGAGVVVADIDSDSKLVGSYAPDAWHPLISQQ